MKHPLATTTFPEVRARIKQDPMILLDPGSVEARCPPKPSVRPNVAIGSMPASWLPG
jgi:hypothetical protein